MLFDLIFVSVFVAGWLFCAFVPWLAFSVATRGNAGLINLPLALFAGVVAGLAIPLLVNDGWNGLWLSVLAAFLVSGGLMTLRRFTAGALDVERARILEARARAEKAPGSDSPLPEGRK
ncbi:MAG TPA: hypothetical protein VFY90_10980 [Tepidiformaceae bacterium]|nr:hypothetical protein [Tepidiformaceae bacterium]